MIFKVGVFILLWSFKVHIIQRLKRKSKFNIFVRKNVNRHADACSLRIYGFFALLKRTPGVHKTPSDLDQSGHYHDNF